MNEATPKADEAAGRVTNHASEPAQRVDAIPAHRLINPFDPECSPCRPDCPACRIAIPAEVQADLRLVTRFVGKVHADDDVYDAAERLDDFLASLAPRTAQGTGLEDDR